MRNLKDIIQEVLVHQHATKDMATNAVSINLKDVLLELAETNVLRGVKKPKVVKSYIDTPSMIRLEMGPTKIFFWKDCIEVKKNGFGNNSDIYPYNDNTCHMIIDIAEHTYDNKSVIFVILYGTDNSVDKIKEFMTKYADVVSQGGLKNSSTGRFNTLNKFIKLINNLDELCGIK